MSYTDKVLAKFPLGYFRLEETSGNAVNSGSVAGVVGLFSSAVVRGVVGLITDGGFSARFSSTAGASSAISMSPIITVADNSSYTLEAWIKTSDAGAGTRMIAGRAGGSGANTNGYLGMLDNIPRMHVRNSVSIAFEAIGPALINDGEDHHLVGSWDSATNVARLYVDGVLVSTVATTHPDSTIIRGGGLSTIGNFNSGAAAFGGDIDEVAFYDYVLTPEQVVENWVHGAYFLPGIPLNVQETSTHRVATITWSASSGSVDGYRVRIDGGSSIDVGAQFSHTFERLVSATDYTLEVQSYGPRGSSAWVSIASRTDDSPYPLRWEQADPAYEEGVDRGVLYPPSSSGVAWTGLTSVSEEDVVELTPLYFDGVKYADNQSIGAFSATLKAFTYPDELDDLYRFGLSYRTREGRDIHLVYNVVARATTRIFQTTSGTVAPSEFEWALSSVPVILNAFRSTGHYMINTDTLTQMQLRHLENTLYGSETSEPYLPTIEEIARIIQVEGEWIFTNNGNGLWSATGPDELYLNLGGGRHQLREVDATLTAPGTYEIPA